MPEEHEEEPVMDFGKKKKKEKKEKKEKKDGAAEEAVELVETEFEKGELMDYEEMLQRVRDTIDAKHSGMGIKEKYTLTPPEITRVGAKKTGWVNFQKICDNMNRSTEHLSSYVFAELGCDGTMAGEGQFILKGRFYPRNIESLLRKYIREYVMCAMCRSSNTQLSKDQATRLNIITCSNCGASRTCQSIKSGFHAVAKGERRRQRTGGNTQVQG
ncbi:unnamed protein product [Amoebophrya sp. A120]|nr:unnamed protein product [Amoebophrya sp. A120]|eukprot:GSA120T00018772001.1